MSVTLANALPSLREDLQLLLGPSRPDGMPTWTIFDPVRNKFFRIDWRAFQLLSNWGLADSTSLRRHVADTTTVDATEADVEALILFLSANSLTRDPPAGELSNFLQQYELRKTRWLRWLLTNYLFFRIPLLRPQPLLDRTLAWVEPLFSNGVRNLVFLCGVLGVYLVGRQWDVFVTSFLHFFSFQGLVFYALALVFVKVLHELGHAYAATRYGCKVATMGVAFLVLFPVLYTDVTDSWRLRSRRQRVLIASAGVLTEFYLALLCTFIWSFLPEGTLRSAVFVLATTSWIMTLGVNLNAAMRFDGYYILSDYLEVQNLQQRAFALGRWRLREILFGLGLPAPELFTVAMRRTLVGYAWFVWIYRLLIFTAIAIVVYYIFFKLLGLILFVAEIIWFIVLPIQRELLVWWKMREQIKHGRRFVPLMLLGGVSLALIVFPWSTRVSVPAILKAESTQIFAPDAGRLVELHVHRGQRVAGGQSLLRLQAPHLDEQIFATGKEIEILELRSRRRVANPEDLADLQVILQRLEQQKSTLAGLRELRERLHIRSPVAGRVVDLAEALHQGRWINERLSIATIVTDLPPKIVGMVPETDIDRLGAVDAATFYPDDPQRPSFQTRLLDIGLANVSNLEVNYLSSAFGGDIAVRFDAHDHAVPETSVYEAKFSVGAEHRSAQVIPGVVHVQGEPKSFARRAFEIVATVLVRESGF